jgi:hypothetical protein
MGSSERAVAEFGARGNLEGLEALFRCPDRDVVQRESRQAGRQEPELHVATSVQAPVRADPSTVSVIRTATEGSATEGGAGCPGATVSRAAAVLDGMRPGYIDRRLKGAFIQIMPLTWDSFLLPVMDKNPWLTI